MTFIDPKLHGVKEPVGIQVRQTEQPWHRAAAYMLANGMAKKDVARACDVSPITIGHLVKNEWFQRLITGACAEAGQPALQKLIEGESVASLLKMIEIRDDPKTQKHVAAGICKDILDRTCGKAVQRVEVDSTVRSADPVEEAKQLERENAILAKRLGVSVEQKN